MRCRKFRGANVVMQPPEGENEDTCVPAYAFVGHGIVATCWELDDADRARLAAGGDVWLIVRGNTMPPVKMTTEDMEG